MNLAIVVAVLLLVFVVSERWWLGTALTYLPRAPWGMPAIVLGVAALMWHRPSLWPNLITIALVAGPLMEFRAPGLSDAREGRAASESAPSLKMVSCNVQGYQPDFAAVLEEVARLRPDIVVLQEARGDHRLLVEFFPDWHRIHVDYYWVAARWPLKLVHTCESAAFNRVSGILVEVDAPQGPLAIANIHQMTARRGLKQLTGSELATGAAQSELEDFQMLRLAESGELRSQLAQHSGNRPLVVAGDFNTPASSSLFQQVWGDLTSAFDVAGVGYGYTSPVKPQRYWVSYLPWARIDHLLCSPDWSVRDCRVGISRGSDHHLIYAELVR